MRSGLLKTPGCSSLIHWQFRFHILLGAIYLVEDMIPIRRWCDGSIWTFKLLPNRFHVVYGGAESRMKLHYQLYSVNRELLGCRNDRDGVS